MMVRFRCGKFRLRLAAFTLLEVMTSVVVIAILAVMGISTFGFLRAKAERAKCVRNLQGLYAAGASYLTDNGAWPQISTLDIEAPAFSKAWIQAFQPYGIGHVNWICATVQTAIGDPPYDPDEPRIDYLGTGFDDKPNSPWQWPTHPWFIERANAHGDGNLIIFTNGQIRSLDDMKKEARPIPTKP